MNNLPNLNPFSGSDGSSSQTPSRPPAPERQHTEEQKRHFYDSLPAEEKEKKSYSEWVKEAYNDQYEKWMPWLEDQYLKWFGGGDNKASYIAKGMSTPTTTSIPASASTAPRDSTLPIPFYTSIIEGAKLTLSTHLDNLDKTKISGDPRLDQLQDDTNNLIGNQLGEKGYLAPVGNLVSKEGVNRGERGGKDESGSYGGSMLGGVTDPVVNGGKSAGQGISSGAQSVGSSVGGVFGGGSKQ
ncbi:uncharacterized protein BDV14DRAFT_199947 [Aspergillus stella-maris]|uniref:uncharacterized protein n=1 Tax=Aspergillus stella-maris TaxID=1810926 RepID=UPI003CCCB111